MNSRVNGGRELPESVYRRDVAARTAGAITKSAGGYAIADTSTTAKVGDLYRAETATTSVMAGKEYLVIEASTNSFTIASKDLPVLGDTFFILAPTTLRIASDGSLSATISGSATEAKQDTMITSLQLLDDSVVATGAAVPAKGIQVTGTDGTNARALKTDASGELQIDVLSSALPSGAATSAKQDTLDTSINTLLKPASTLTAVTTVGTVSSVTAIANALPAGTNNIGDVDVLTLPIAYNTGNVGATTQRVVIASDQTAYSVNVANSPIVFAQAYATASSTSSTSRVSSTALEVGHVIKNGAGRLYSLMITSTRTSAQFIQIHNTTSVPADTAVPVYSFYIPAASSISLSAEDIGDYFDTGISVCNSSTIATKTVGAADCFFTARYL